MPCKHAFPNTHTEIAALNWSFIKQVGYRKWLFRTLVRQGRKRFLGLGCTLTLPTGCDFPIPRQSHSGSEVFTTDADVDFGAEALLARVVPPATTFLDVGANIGYYSAYLYPCVAFVHAFEPDRRAWPSLQSLADRLTNLTVHPVAISDHCGRAALRPGTSSETSALDGCTNAGERVEIRTLDSLIPSFSGPVGAIKIDTEGHEAFVLRGAPLLISRDRPIVVLETQAEEWLFEWACAHGYCVAAPICTAPLWQHRFEWLTAPGAVGIKMAFLVPLERQQAVAQAAASLYPTQGRYATALKAFQSSTRTRLKCKQF